MSTPSDHNAGSPGESGGLSKREALERMVAIVESVEPTNARFISVATVLGAILRRVLSVQKTAATAAISLGQQTIMDQMRSEMSEMIETLGKVLPEQVSLEKVPSGEEPSWWFALSEVTQELEASIEQLSVLVRQQEKGSAIRDFTAQVQRLLREHYNTCLEQARNWMDG